MPAGEVASTSNPQCFYVPKDNEEAPKPVVIPRTPHVTPPRSTHVTPPRGASARLSNSPKKGAAAAAVTARDSGDQMTKCDVCSGSGSTINLVRLEIYILMIYLKNFVYCYSCGKS